MGTQKHDIVWKNCQDVIRDNIPAPAYNTWFAPIHSVSLENSILTIEVQSDYVREHIEANFLDLLSKVLHRVIGPEARLRYKVRIADTFITENQRSTARLRNVDIPAPDVAATYEGNPYLIPGIKRLNIDSHLNPQYSMENFIEGECNRLARAAGVSIARTPGRNAFNPLFIYAGPGLGKTHLAQAIGISVKEQYPEKVVLYVNANTFQNQYMNAACSAKSNNNSNEVSDFLRYYQLVDVLIIDDVQEFADKKGTQGAFFHIFNYLHQCGKQLILTSDRAPVDLQNFEDRLLSRFKWGLSVELRRPDYQTRLAMLKARCFREGVPVSDKVLEFLATRIKSNFRELEGALISLIAHATLTHQEDSIELAERITGHIIEDEQNDLSIDRIQSAVCDYFNLTRETLVSPSRKRQIVQARQIAMYLCRNLISNCSLSAIGAEIGGKDHATVLHACTTVSDLMSTDRVFKQYVCDIERMLVPADR